MFENLIVLTLVLVFGGIGVYSSANVLLTELNRAIRKGKRSGGGIVALAVTALALASQTGLSFAQATPVPLELDINLQPLFQQIGTYLPLFLGVLAVGGAIGIAVKLSKFIIGSISSGFGGGK